MWPLSNTIAAFLLFTYHYIRCKALILVYESRNLVGRDVSVLLYR